MNLSAKYTGNIRIDFGSSAPQNDALFRDPIDVRFRQLMQVGFKSPHRTGARKFFRFSTTLLYGQVL